MRKRIMLIIAILLLIISFVFMRIGILQNNPREYMVGVILLIITNVFNIVRLGKDKE